jgi:hypothetical protein
MPAPGIPIAPMHGVPDQAAFINGEVTVDE